MSDSLWKIGSLEGNTAEETQDTDEDSYRIESLEEDSENTEQDTQDVISVLHLLMVHIQQMDFPLKAAQGKRRSLVKVSL